MASNLVYNVTYTAPAGADEATTEAVTRLNEDHGTDQDMATIVANCKRLKIDAKLTDTAGKPKGWAKADGTSGLT